MLINVGNASSPILVPVEQCEVLPGQMAKKKLSQEQTQAMIKYAVRRPEENVNLILQEGIRVMGFGPNFADGPVSSILLSLITGYKLINFLRAYSS